MTNLSYYKKYLKQKLASLPPKKIKNKKITAWATAIASQNAALVAFIKDEVGVLSAEERKIITIASSRMAVTNPYFMGRNVFPLQSGGTLNDINMRPFQALDIHNKTSYHCACIAISSVNNGFICFGSHVNSLRTSAKAKMQLTKHFASLHLC